MWRFVARLLLCAGSVVPVRAGPYPPAAGQAGSTAIDKDDPAFVAWATGWQDYTVGADVNAEWQTPEKALGKAEGTSFDIVTLGRGGQITMTFDTPIVDGPGVDFAVFENSITDTFLELAWAEVSSDGINFVRMDNDSLTPDPVGGFGIVDPTDIDGLAGKYRQGFGTPFDLADVGLSSATHVRLRDIPGDGSAFDTSGDVIYDPYPTIGSAGFDLDAVGVIHTTAAPVPVGSGGGLAFQALALLIGGIVVAGRTRLAVTATSYHNAQAIDC